MAATRAEILDAYRRLVSRPGGCIHLSVLRAALPHVGFDALSGMLLAMDADRLIQLEPDPDRLGLTAAMKAAAVLLAGEPMHLMREVC